MLITILYGGLLLNSIVITSTASKELICQPNPVCGTDGNLYETTCDFQRARELNPNLRISFARSKTKICSSVPPLNSKPMKFLEKMDSTDMLKHRRLFFLIPLCVATSAAIMAGTIYEMTPKKTSHTKHKHDHQHNHTHITIQLTRRS